MTNITHVFGESVMPSNMNRIRDKYQQKQNYKPFYLWE